MIKGLDVGYSSTKDNEGRIFQSAYNYCDKSVLGAKRLSIDGKDYYIGNGIRISDPDKTNSEMNKVCTINNLVLTGSGDYKICVGLPVAQYKVQKKKLKENILEYQKCRVYVNNEFYKFTISDVYVVMQGVASLYSLSSELTGDFIVIDIGGLTIDVSLVSLDNHLSMLQSYDTWYKGIRTLYGEIMERVNNEYGLKLDNTYAENILKNGCLEVDGKKECLDFIKPFLKGYVDEIIEEIKIKYPTRTAHIVLTGGGALLMYNAFKNRFQGCAMIPEPQFSNARGYYAIACQKFR